MPGPHSSSVSPNVGEVRRPDTDLRFIIASRDNWSDSPAFLAYPNAHVSIRGSETRNFTLPTRFSSRDERGIVCFKIEGGG